MSKNSKFYQKKLIFFIKRLIKSTKITKNSKAKKEIGKYST